MKKGILIQSHSPKRGLVTALLVAACAAIPCLSSHAADPESKDRSNALENSVVKVFSSVRYPDFYKPWTKQAPREVTGSGVVIEGKRILCNAHAVLYASQVQVQANQAGDKLSATVEAAGPGIDLAVLKLDDETFFASHPPLPRAATLPEIRDVVMAYGYPEGGSSLSTTKGIVSRIEFTRRNYGVSGLWIQIDAAINPGNSGGPAVVGDKMVGLTFSRLNGADNIGYIIANEEIDLFLQDIVDGQYEGKPALFDELQTLENPALRSFLKLDRTVEGLVVHNSDSAEPDYPLKKWDVITRIGNTALDNQGMIKLPDVNLRLGFRYLIQKIAKNGKVPLTIVRSGKELTVDVPVPSKRPLLIPHSNGAFPSYFVYGSLVFSSLTTELVENLPKSKTGVSWMNALVNLGSPLVRRMGDKPDFAGQRLVMVSSFFPHKLAKSYDDPVMRVVKTVNGLPIKNLGHLVEVLRDARDEFITIEFDIRGSQTLVFRRSDMRAVTDEILTENGIRSQGSADTLAIWNGQPSAVKGTAVTGSKP